MKNYNRLSVTDVEFLRIVNSQLSNKRMVYEERIGQRRKLYIDSDNLGADGKPIKKLLCTNKVENSFKLSISEKDFMLFLAHFKKELKRNLKKLEPLPNPENIKYVVGRKNFEFWKSISIGTCFYNIDIKSAYWQMGHKLGYIGDNMFNAYFDLDTYKEPKRLCISFLGRTKKVINHNTNKTESVDTSLEKRVYSDIRNLLYSHITKIADLVDGEYVSYITDGIYLKNDKVDIVKKYLKDNDIVFKITKCKKVSDTSYMNGSKLSNFSKNGILSDTKEK
jgi:hypothetical protein